MAKNNFPFQTCIKRTHLGNALEPVQVARDNEYITAPLLMNLALFLPLPELSDKTFFPCIFTPITIRCRINQTKFEFRSFSVVQISLWMSV